MADIKQGISNAVSRRKDLADSDGKIETSFEILS